MAAPVEAPADQPEPWRVEGREAIQGQGETATRVDLGCDVTTWLEHKGELHFACGAQAWVLRLDAPSQRRALNLEWPVRSFFLRADVVWVELARVEARPVQPGALTMVPAQPPMVQPPESPSTPTPSAVTPPVLDEELFVAEGTVLETHRQEVTIDFGASKGLAVDQRVEFYELRTVELGGVTEEREVKLAVGVVTQITDTRAVITLGVNENVPIGSHARTSTKRRSRSLIAPPRAQDLVNLHLGFRPFLALSDLGFGAMSEFGATFRTHKSMAVHALLEPVVFGVASESRYALMGLLALTYDHRLFEVGLGLGGGALTDETCDFDANDSLTCTAQRISVMALGQVARLGAIDGAHLALRNRFILVGGDFVYGDTIGEIQFPTGKRTWVVLKGGGGRGSWGFGEAGLRVLLRGNGGPGSLFITPGIGGAGIGQYAGPQVGLSLDWRIGTSRAAASRRSSLPR